MDLPFFSQTILISNIFQFFSRLINTHILFKRTTYQRQNVSSIFLKKKKKLLIRYLRFRFSISTESSFIPFPNSFFVAPSIRHVSSFSKRERKKKRKENEPVNITKLVNISSHKKKREGRGLTLPHDCLYAYKFGRRSKLLGTGFGFVLACNSGRS